MSDIRTPLLRSFLLVAVCILAAAAWILARASTPSGKSRLGVNTRASVAQLAAHPPSR